MSRFEVPFDKPETKSKLLEMYRRTNHMLHVDQNSTQQRSVVFWTDSTASCLGWHREQFELYAVFSPLVTKESAVAMTSRLINWMKQEENALFVVSTPAF